MTTSSSKIAASPFSISGAQRELDSILGEIVYSITEDGDVEGNKFLLLAETHGSGFLTGSAAALLDVATNQFGADREVSLLAVAKNAILAVIADRRADGETAAFAAATPSPTLSSEIKPAAPDDDADLQDVDLKRLIDRLIGGLPPASLSAYGKI